MSYNLLAFSGSFRKDSYNTSLLRAFKKAAPEGVSIELADYTDIPFYNQDDEAAYPETAAKLKARIRAADGIIIATPEYNRSIPGMLKNMIDWTSRPYGDSGWNGKPVYVLGGSIGNTGAALAQYDLKKVMLYLNAHVPGQPEFFGTTMQDKVPEGGELADAHTEESIVNALAAFTAYIDTVR